jgi:hypothetical protein
MEFVANLFVPSLTDVGYQFYDNTGAAIGSRTTTSVAESALVSGKYIITNATVPSGAAGIYWNSSGTPSANASEDFDPRLPVIPTGTSGAIITAGSGAAQLQLDGSGSANTNLVKIVGTAVSSPATAGILDVNVKNIVNAAVSTTTAQIGVNVVKINADATAPGNLANTYNGAGYTNANAPAQQSQVANIAVTSAALNTVATANSITTGTETSGTYASTATADQVYDQITAATGTIDFYYQFSVGTAGGAATSVSWLGYLSGAANSIKVYAYNWAGTSWDQVGTIGGITGTIESSVDFDLTSAHTGAGGSAGLVRIRFQNTGLTVGVLNTDRILVGYAVVTVFPSGFLTTSFGSTVSSLTQTQVTGYAGPILTDNSTGLVSANVTKTLGTAVTLDSNNVLNVSTKYFGGALLTARDIGANVLLSSGTGAGQLSLSSGTVTLTPGSFITATLGNVLMPSNLTEILGAAVSTPATAGILDVNLKNIAGTASAGQAGYMGIDWGNVYGKTSTVSLTGTTINLVTTTTTVTNQLTAATVATGVWQDATAGDFTQAGSIGKSLFTDGVIPGASGGIATYANVNSSIGSILGTIEGATLTCNVTQWAGAGVTGMPMPAYTQPPGFLAATFPTGTVASTTNITAGTITTATNLTNAPTAGDFTAAMKASMLSTTWDSDISGHTASGTFGGALNAAGSAGDPWSTTLPGSYAPGTAGYIVGTNLNAAITSRSTYSGGDTSGTTTLLSRIPTFPTNFSTLGISSGGKISEVALVDTLTTYSGNTLQTGDAYSLLNAKIPNNIAMTGSAVWSLDASGNAIAPLSAMTTAQTTLNNIYAVTESLATSSAVSTLSANITTDFSNLQTHGDAHWATPTGFALASDMAQLISTLELVSGTTYQFTAQALANAPGAGIAPTAEENAAELLNTAVAGFEIAGTVGATIAAAGNSGDPWTTVLPGAYTGNQAGAILPTILLDMGAARVQVILPALPAGANYFILERSFDGINYTVVQTGLIGGVTFYDAGLPRGLKIWYRLVAVGGSGSTPGNPFIINT